MDWVPLIRETAHSQGLDEDLFQAVCTHESSLNPLMIRYEPNFKWYQKNYRDFADHIGISPETEIMLESCSFGLPQVMGTVARDNGFKGPLTQLISEPQLALIHGAVHLKSFLQRYGSEVDAISAYNQGSNEKTPGGMFVNQTYVDAVSTELAKLRKLKE